MSAFETDLSNWASWRVRLRQFIEQSRFQKFIIALILVNAVILGLETDSRVMAAVGSILIAIDQVILAVFVIELTLRLLVHRLRFFRDPWSVFDFLVVGIAFVPASSGMEVLRALRVLRVLRLLTMIPSMRRVVGGMLKAIPGLGSVGAILLIVFYVSAVMATNLFGKDFPEWFGSLPATSYTLFQVMTLESWSMGISRPVMEVYPYAWIFFVLFILIATFTMLNLVMGVIVNAIQDVQSDGSDKVELPIGGTVENDTLLLQQELVKVRSDLAEIKTLLKDRLG